MNIRKNQAIILAIEAGVFLLSLLCLCVQKCSSFVGYSRVGVIVLLIDMLLFCKVQKKNHNSADLVFRYVYSFSIWFTDYIRV